MKHTYRRRCTAAALCCLLLAMGTFPLTVSGEDTVSAEKEILTEETQTSPDKIFEEETEEDASEETAEEEEIPVKDIEVDDTETTVAVDETISLTGTVVPADAAEQTVTYSSSDPSVAKVNSAGEVRGISRGEAVITLEAGGVKKEIPVTVNVPTASMEIDKDYLVLKEGETCLLSVSVTPSDADQNVTFSSADREVAVVSASGVVTATGKGSTTLIVSNADQSLPVSVIVNEAVRYEEDEKDAESQGGEGTETKEEERTPMKGVIVSAADKEVIKEKTLQRIYEKKQTMHIEGKGYRLMVEGSDIVNVKNVLYTDIDLKTTSAGMEFTLNRGLALCGPVLLYLEEPQGSYLYLYNEEKEKYEEIDITDVKELHLLSPGKYRLCVEPIRESSEGMIYAILVGCAVLILCSIIYVFVKKKYWFW